MKKSSLFAASIGLGFMLLLNCSCSKSNNGTGSTYTPPPAGSGSAVSIASMKFSPATITVAKGTIVVWTNNDGFPHTVKSNDNKSFDSGNISAGGGKYSYTATTAGTFDYHCAIHGLSMAGTLVVNP